MKSCASSSPGRCWRRTDLALKNDIHIRKSGVAGRITLTRPDALNAMTYDMCMAIGDAIGEWEHDDSIKLVIIDAEGDRAFCSGGDIADLYATGKSGNFDYGRKFWADEYRINAKIRNYNKPYVAIMDGIVMGGGVGISAHGSHRVVTEHTLFAMPECGIGLVPDVGGNWLLSRAPGRLGEYLAITGARLKADDCITAGIGDIFIPSEKLPEMIDLLEKTGDLAVLDTSKDTAEKGSLEIEFALIDQYFSQSTAAEIVKALETNGGEWETKAAKLIRRGSPLSIACAIEIVRTARGLDGFEDILALEYRFTYRSMSHGDFIEGVRAQIISKDRNPKWKPATLEELDEREISGMLEPLGSDALAF